MTDLDERTAFLRAIWSASGHAAELLAGRNRSAIAEYLSGHEQFPDPLTGAPITFTILPEEA